MNTFSQDLRYALRGLSRNRGFTAVAILTIGIGIGANTTVFSWMHGLLLNPLPGAAEPERVVMVESVAANGDPLTTSYLDYRDFRDHLRSFENLSLFAPAVFAVGDDERTQRVWGEFVSGNYFDAMRVQAAAGRFFSGAERDDAQNVHSVLVISHAFWKARYNLSESAIGATVRINRTPFTIIGVAAPAFHGSQSGLSFDLWVPATMYGQVTHTGTWMLRDRNTRNFTMLARLRPAVTIAQAREETRALAGRMAVLDADTNQGVGAEVLPVWKGHFTPQAVILAPISILMGAAGLFLLIVCANVANLLLARATGRRKEFSIRLALGARPARLVRQLLTETLLLAVAGGAAGLAIANWLGGSLRWLLPRVAAPAILQPELDPGVLLFTTAAAFAVAILAGTGPALTAARANVNDVLKQGGRSGASVPSGRLRGPLVVGEVALAVIALVGGGLLMKSFAQARSIHPGFTAEGVALTRFDLSSAGYNAQQADAFCRRLRESLERTPGVTAVSYDDSPPLGFQGGNWEPIEVEGYVAGRSENMKINRDMISPGYFELMKIPLLAGRDFDLGDTATKLHNDPAYRKVMIVNQEFARRFFAGRDPIGRKVRGWGEWFTVVGVAGNIKYQRLTEGPRPFVYIPIRQVYRPEYGLTFHVRTVGPVAEAIAAIRREAAAIDRGLMIFDSMEMKEYISASLYGQKVGAILLNVLGGLGLLMAALGLYSVMAYSVAQREAEIGIRMAMGAKPRDMMLLVLRQGLGFAMAGLALGALASAALGRVLAAVLVSVSPADPGVYAGAAAFTVAVAVFSAGIPAWRALRVDPVVALRSE